MSCDTFDKLSPKQERAVIALLDAPTIAKAAEAIGVCERTLYRWLDDSDFAAAYRKARRQAFGVAIGLVQKYAPVAVNCLVRVTTDVNAPASAKVAAATALLRFGREGIETDDLAVRVEALEQVEASRRVPGRAA